MITKSSLSKILIKKLSKNKEYLEALDIVKKNSTGKIYLIGGIVSRSLIEEIYGVEQKEFDFDFLIEKLNTKLVIPKGWEVKRTKHGNPTFFCGKKEIDLFPIKTHDHIVSNKLKPTIENFFLGTPFTIQALAFDTIEQKVIGDLGILALKKREYKVNNLKQATDMAKTKNETINSIIERKAKSLGLKPIYVKQ